MPYSVSFTWWLSSKSCKRMVDQNMGAKLQSFATPVKKKNSWNHNLEYISTILYTNFLINPWHFLKQARFPVPEPITYFLHNYGQKYIIIFPWNQFYENFREINFTENINWPEHQQGVHPKGFDSCKPNVPWWQRSQLIPSTFTLHSHCPWLHSEKFKKSICITENNSIIYFT